MTEQNHQIVQQNSGSKVIKLLNQWSNHLISQAVSTMHSYAQWTKKHNINNKMWKKEKMIRYECDTKTHTIISCFVCLFVFLLNILHASRTFSSFCSFPVLMNSSIFFAIFSPTPSLKNERRKHFCKWKRDIHRNRHWQ